ncbi:MAG TPA: hypothetical protein VFZ44_15855 [Pyrinomonadaceae bacterium]
MNNPFRAFRDRRQQAFARARERRGWHLFWIYMTMGLEWGIFMFAFNLIMEYFGVDGGGLVSGSLQLKAAVYFVGGMLFGLFLWTVQEFPAARHRDQSQ